MDIDNKKTPMVVALDIGTTKICAIAGYRNEFGKIEILGMKTVKSEGVLRGVVSNIDKTVKAIKEAVEVAEVNAGKKFHKVHVGIAGQHIKSQQHRGLLVRKNSNSEISSEDIKKLIDDIHILSLPPGDKILHIIPQEYTVDNEHDITDPVGMSGVKLEANFHVITNQVEKSRNLFRVVEKSGLKVADMTLEPIASAAAVLSEEEKEAGAILVDIGGGTTDITIFKGGIIRHTHVIPLGGNVVTSDIQEGLTVMKEQAEKLKVKYGAALAEEIVDNRLIVISEFKGRDKKEISEKNLARIIQARMEEIFDFVMWEIKRSGYENKLLAGMILTGGGALLKDVDFLAELQTGLKTRLGRPIEHLAHGYKEDLTLPIFSTSIGLLIKAIEKGDFVEEEIEINDNTDVEEEVDKEDEIENKEPKKRGVWDKVLSFTKEFFETTPESEF